MNEYQSLVSLQYTFNKCIIGRRACTEVPLRRSYTNFQDTFSSSTNRYCIHTINDSKTIHRAQLQVQNSMAKGKWWWSITQSWWRYLSLQSNEFSFFISSSLNKKSFTSKFSWILAFDTDFGITITPRWIYYKPRKLYHMYINSTLYIVKNELTW